jgi:hypothetical protein
MGTEPLPPGVYPIAVDKYIISYISYTLGFLTWNHNAFVSFYLNKTAFDIQGKLNDDYV